VRTGDHEDYSRVVFDWDHKVEYKVSKGSNGTLNIVFESAATPDLSAVSINDINNITNIRQTSDGNKLKIILNISDKSEYRHFLIGDRVILDIYNPASSRAGRTASRITRKKKALVKIEPVHGKISKPPSIPAVKTKKLVDISKKKKEGTILDQASGPPPHLITLSFTEAVGIAVFERARALWIVLDKPDVTTPPQLSDPEKSTFPPFKRYELEGGMAFRMEYPENADFLVYAEGGGLLWRIILTPNVRDVLASRPTSVFKKKPAD